VHFRDWLFAARLRLTWLLPQPISSMWIWGWRRGFLAGY
jgi:hypothetical protein